MTERTPRPSASVVIATMGRSALLEGCLEAFGRTLVPGDELIVVEAGGQEGADVVKRSARRAYFLST